MFPRRAGWRARAGHTLDLSYGYSRYKVEQTQENRTQQWLRFLDGLGETTPDRLADLDAAMAFSASGNCEIHAAWLALAIRAGYRAVDDSLELFLLAVGRRKFLKPLYEALLAAEDGKPAWPVALTFDEGSTTVILDRERHAEGVEEIRAAGGRIRFISGGTSPRTSAMNDRRSRNVPRPAAASRIQSSMAMRGGQRPRLAAWCRRCSSIKVEMK